MTDYIDIKKISSDRDDLDKLNLEENWIPSSLNTRRSEDLQKKYEIQLKYIDDWYLSFKDYILCEIFNFDCEMTNDGKLIHVYPENDFYIKSRLEINKFPYLLPKNTKHYVMWFLEKQTDENIINQNILIEIISKNIFAKKVVWYENPKIHNDIYHIHVFLNIN
jgi:hypothetical protein